MFTNENSLVLVIEKKRKSINNFLLNYINYKFFEFIFLPFFSITNVYFIQSYLPEYFSYKFYESQYILINVWFFYHVFNSMFVAKYYPYALNLQKMCFFVFGWEFIENIVAPGFGYLIQNEVLMNQYTEPWHDIFGDIVAAVPSMIYIYIYR